MIKKDTVSKNTYKIAMGLTNVNYPSLQENREKIVIKIKISRQLNT